MAEFLIALMALITTFAQGGKPANLPPHTQEEVSVRGSQVSEVAKNIDPQDSNNQGSEVSEQTPDSSKDNGKSFGQTVSSEAKASSQNQSASDTNGVNAESANTTKVAAENTESYKPVPTLLPQVSIDHSVALEASVDESSNAEVNNQNANAQGNSNANADFGQQVAVSQPDSAKDNGQTFGQSTSELAKENSRRP